MQRVRDPFAEALCAIRRHVRAGRYVRGERLAIADLAQELDLSATPVREALARLAGEGLIEERRGQGYFAWRPDVVDLTELYELQGAYLGFALARAGGRLELDAAVGGPHDGGEALFAQIVRQSNSAALARANRLLADRLAAPRLAEAQVLDNLSQEFEDLLASHRADRLGAALAAYHKRRIGMGQAIIAALRSFASEALEI